MGPQGPRGLQGLTGNPGADGTLPIWELCISLALTFLGIYLAKALIDFYLRKFKHKHGGITFEYERGA